MTPTQLVNELAERGIAARLVSHRVAQTDEELASALGLARGVVGQTYLLSADGQACLALVPAGMRPDFDLLKDELGANDLQFLDDGRDDALFEDAQPGAEPPFGSLLGVPLVLDESLADQDEIVVRSGRYDTSLEVRVVDLIEVEQPNVAPIAAPAEEPGFPTVGEVGEEARL